MERRFQLVDVFSDQPFSGNPLAVIFDADDLSTEAMLSITQWLNLSETTFLLPPTTPDADYQVRIFTQTGELPFAGHPTLGSCHAWLAAGGTPQQQATIVQECGAGLIAIRRNAAGLAFAAPPLLRSGPIDDTELQAIAEFLRIDQAQIIASQWGVNGPAWAIVLLESADAVLALVPPKAYPTHVAIGAVGFYPPNSPCAIELRAFFSDHTGGVMEDPVTGSLNAATAQWLLSSNRMSAPYTASQGTRLNRNGRITITQDHDGVIWVGGNTTVLFTGTGSF